jgi:hypothetical protein
MGHDWILDVLADLKGFADQNGLPLLASQLDDTKLVALAEITSSADGAPISVYGERAETGHLFRATGSGPRA